jgi:RHS repeat-associated protein
MDRFGRVIDHVWRNCATATNGVEIQHGYDRVGNRLWRNDAVALAAGQKLDELYGYDGLNQLVSLNRGQLDETRTALVTDTKTFAEAWSLDMTGNWSAYQEDTNGDGTWDLSQTRTHDPANEITAITTTVGDAWISPTHDRNGNILMIPNPKSPTTAFGCVYDAWNRLVRVTDGSTTVAEYQYDGRNFRALKAVYADGTLSEVRHSYYNSNWQELEQRAVTTLTTAPWSQSPVSQYIWGLRYIDDLVLRDRDTSTTPDGMLEERLYALQDGNWNVVTLVDTTGEVAERYTYSAYGAATAITPEHSLLGDSRYDWEYLFSGRQYDIETVLAYYRARYYHHVLGVFVSVDPIRYAGGNNWYEYVHNQPTVAVDSTGLWRFVPGMGTLSGDLGPGDTATYGEASSSCHIQFDRDREAFVAGSKVAPASSCSIMSPKAMPWPLRTTRFRNFFDQDRPTASACGCEAKGSPNRTAWCSRPLHPA